MNWGKKNIRYKQPTGDWVNIAITYDPINGVKHYINGKRKTIRDKKGRMPMNFESIDRIIKTTSPQPPDPMSLSAWVRGPKGRLFLDYDIYGVDRKDDAW